MDFLGKFKKACREIDEEPKMCLGEEPKEEVMGPRYDIYKRTVTSGKNKAVFIGLPFDDAQKKLAALNLTEQKRREEYKNSQLDKGIIPSYEEIVYFDLVPQDKPEQRSLYYNSRPVSIER